MVFMEESIFEELCKEGTEDANESLLLIFSAGIMDDDGGGVIFCTLLFILTTGCVSSMRMIDVSTELVIVLPPPPRLSLLKISFGSGRKFFLGLQVIFAAFT